MDWGQTLTIIATTVGSTYTFYHMFYNMVKEDIKRHDEELKFMREEFSKRDALWADLLKQIHEIKLFQASRQ
jgi:hypothetical protein